MSMTEQMQRDLASVTNLGFENVREDLSHFSRGSTAPINEDVLHLDDATVRSSNTQIIPVTEDASDVSLRLSRNTGNYQGK